MPDLRCPDPACIGNTSDDEHPQFTLLIMVDEHQNPCFPLAKVEAEEFTCVYCDLKVAPPKRVGTERIVILLGRTHLQTAHVVVDVPEDLLVRSKLGKRMLGELYDADAADAFSWVEAHPHSYEEGTHVVLGVTDKPADMYWDTDNKMWRFV